MSNIRGRLTDLIVDFAGESPHDTADAILLSAAMAEYVRDAQLSEQRRILRVAASLWPNDAMKDYEHFCSAVERTHD